MTVRIDSQYVKNGAPPFLVIGVEAGKALRGRAPDEWMKTALQKMPDECLQLLDRVIVYCYWMYGSSFVTFIQDAERYLSTFQLSVTQRQLLESTLRIYKNISKRPLGLLCTEERPRMFTAKITQEHNFNALHEELLAWQAKSVEQEKLVDAAFYAGVASKDQQASAGSSRSVIAAITQLMGVQALRTKRSVYIAYDQERRLHGVLILRLASNFTGNFAAIDSLAANPANLDLVSQGKTRVKGAGTALLAAAVRDMQSITDEIQVLSTAQAVPFYKKAGFALDPFYGDQAGERSVHLCIEKEAQEKLIAREAETQDEPDCLQLLTPLRGTAELLRHARLRGFLKA